MGRCIAYVYNVLEKSRIFVTKSFYELLEWRVLTQIKIFNLLLFVAYNYYKSI